MASTSKSNVDQAKTHAFEFLERNKKAIGLLGDSIFYFGELGMQEYETSKLMTDLLEKGGFKVERGISGIPTAFMATFGSGEPVIAIHTEFDGNPGNSQQAGVAERREIVEGAPGHCEGHNVNAAVMVSGALAIARSMKNAGIKGTLKVFGAPAEEQVVSRPFFVRDGYFKDVDLALHDHIDRCLATEWGPLQSALISVQFTFRGVSAHAATAPWMAKNALDAVSLMDIGMAHYREHFEPGMLAQRVITDGGDQPNVIPAKATIWWYLRHSNADGVRKLFERAREIGQGAAMMTGTTMETHFLSAVWPNRANQTVAETIQQNVEIVGMPEWTKDEDNLARQLQQQAGVKVVGLATEITPLKGPAKQRPSANDSGDVAWVVPTAQIRYPANIPNVPYHHWAGGVALATSIAHKGALAGAKVLAASALDFFLKPELVARAKETFKTEIGDVTYKPLLDDDAPPPTHLNKEMMDAFRPKMREHYVKEKVEFA
jgi:aminobenzoyl-glutamate utilization protein B